MLELRAIVDPRRDLLVTANNPARRLDYIITIDRHIHLHAFEQPVHLVIRYVPDACILEKDAISPYLEMVQETPWDNLESMTRTILDDFSNELVARWTEVIVTESATTSNAGTSGYGITMEDRQPTWSNSELLARSLRY